MSGIEGVLSFPDLGNATVSHDQPCLFFALLHRDENDRLPLDLKHCLRLVVYGRLCLILNRTIKNASDESHGPVFLGPPLFFIMNIFEPCIHEVNNNGNTVDITISLSFNRPDALYLRLILYISRPSPPTLGFNGYPSRPGNAAHMHSIHPQRSGP